MKLLHTLYNIIIYTITLHDNIQATKRLNIDCGPPRSSAMFLLLISCSFFMLNIIIFQFEDCNILYRWLLILLFCYLFFGYSMFCNFLFCNFLFCNFLFCNFLFCNFLFCNFLFCNLLFCNLLFCNLLFCNPSFSSLHFCLYPYPFSVRFYPLLQAHYLSTLPFYLSCLISSWFHLPQANPDSPQGDPDTPPQKYFTIMVERIPGHLRSAAALYKFFEKLFPGKFLSFYLSMKCYLSLPFVISSSLTLGSGQASFVKISPPFPSLTPSFISLNSQFLPSNQSLSHSLTQSLSDSYHLAHSRRLPLSLSVYEILGEVYNVEIALDLKELNSITRQRQTVRDSLEKAIAYYEATNMRPEVFIQTGKVW